MGPIKAEIVKAAAKANAVTTELNAEEFAALKKSIEEKYVDRAVYSRIKRFPLMWKAFSEPLIAIRSPLAWTWVDDFVKGKENVLLLIDDVKERAAFKFDSGRDIFPVLEDCFGFEFYLTNEATNFLLCSQRDDYLVALGDATEWLKAYLISKKLSPTIF